MSPRHFQCTQCGHCCRGLWLPLSIPEALDWLADGLPVDLLCEAIPWPADPPDLERSFAGYRKQRSFAARSGALPIRVLVTLAAPQGRQCPRLTEAGLCRIYARRPAVCRVYPAETNPWLTLSPAARLCPPEAWAGTAPVFLAEGRYTEPGLDALARQVDERAIGEIGALAAVCAALGIAVAAQAREGYVVHTPDPARLAAALRQAPSASSAPSPADVPAGGDWQLFSREAGTLEILAECAARVVAEEALPQAGCRFVSGAG